MIGEQCSMTRDDWSLTGYELDLGPGGERRRSLTVAIPRVVDALTCRMIYCTDGQVVPILADQLQASLPEAEFPILIGVHSDSIVRAQEYLASADDLYRRHAKFFVERLPAWVRGNLGISAAREDSAIFGFSNGGAFAVVQALSHPDKFRAAIALSVPQFGDLPAPSQVGLPTPRCYLAAGDQGPEKSIRKQTMKLVRELQRREISAEYHQRTAGHTLDFWAAELVLAVQWWNAQIPGS